MSQVNIANVQKDVALPRTGESTRFWYARVCLPVSLSSEAPIARSARLLALVPIFAVGYVES